MSKPLILGAINKHTGKYVYPKIANKKEVYICPECNKELILVQGKIKAHHFRHKVESINPCYHYSSPTESQIHKDAKMFLKTLLENKTQITFKRKCISCNTSSVITLPEVGENSNINLEYWFNYNYAIRIADIAHTINAEITAIYEICNKHKTDNEDRPEPWVEIDAISLLSNDITSNEPLIVECIRDEECISCINKETKNRSDCKACHGLKTSYWSDDCYGSCTECCCIDCNEFYDECKCKKILTPRHTLAIHTLKSNITVDKALKVSSRDGDDTFQYCILCTRDIQTRGGYSNRYHGIQCFTPIGERNVFGVCDKCYELDYDKLENVYKYISFPDVVNKYVIDTKFRMND